MVTSGVGISHHSTGHHFPRNPVGTRALRHCRNCSSSFRQLIGIPFMAAPVVSIAVRAKNPFVEGMSTAGWAAGKNEREERADQLSGRVQSARGIVSQRDY